MTTYLALLPALIAVVVAARRGPAEAFLLVYLPSLLLLPDYYRAMTIGLPDPTPNQAVAAVVFAFFLLRSAPGYRFSLTDLLVVAYAAAVAWSEYRAAGYADAQNLIVTMLLSVVLPYLLAKSFTVDEAIAIRFLKVIVLCAFLVALISPYEFRFATTPWRQVLDPFFPWQGRGWVTTFRWGFARVAGPYGHAILCGIIMVSALYLQYWLHRARAWGPKPRWLAFVPLETASILTLGLVGGVIMSMTRGPWLAAIFAGVVILIGQSKRRLLVVAGLAVLFVVVGIPTIVAFVDYASVGRENALTTAQESAAYRFELLENYLEIAEEKRWLGWGFNDWPKVPGQPSIDNHYLLLFLRHGLVGLGLFLAMGAWTSLRLLLRGLREPLPAPGAPSLSFALLAVFAGYGLALATVYLGLQTIALFFLLLGFAEQHLLSGPARAPRNPSAAAPPAGRRRFRRVLE